ncbi:MAG: extracellular solute-binding protein [Oscillospiraceae bacterium]|jgi:ABC-type glycerol-3-phosphate transport system substrate-binding protein|nr:extracellular solute-binding protein [Oscillospiraceae bacterium]
MKRVPQLLALALALCLALGAVAVGAEGKDILVSRWAGPHADFQKVLVQDYAPDKATIDDVDYGNMKAKQVLSFQSAQSDSTYDAVWVDCKWMNEYIAGGYLLPIDDYVAQAGIDLGIYAQGMLDGCYGPDGKLYGLPTYAQTLILTYDKEALARSGMGVPTNAEELVALARWFKENEGTGIALPAKQGTASTQVYAQLLFSSGGDFFDADGNLALASEPGIYAAKVYDELAKYGVDGVLAWHHDEVCEAVRTGVAPIGITISGLLNQNSDPELSAIVDTAAYAPLSGSQGAAGNNAFWVWGVAANSPDPKETVDFIAWLTSPATEKAQTLENQQISAVSALSEDPEVIAKTPFLPVVMQVLADGKMYPVTDNIQTMSDALVVGLSEIASTDADPAAVMQRIVDELKNVDFGMKK